MIFWVNVRSIIYIQKEFPIVLVLQCFHHKEKVLNEVECKDIGSAGRNWEWKLMSHLSAKSLGYTQEVVKFLEEANFDSDYLERLKSKLI